MLRERLTHDLHYTEIYRPHIKYVPLKKNCLSSIKLKHFYSYRLINRNFYVILSGTSYAKAAKIFNLAVLNQTQQVYK